MLSCIQKLSTTSKVIILSEMCCIVICIGIILWYGNIDTALLDSFSYYDEGMNFHYYYGIEKFISSIMYIVVLSIIMIMIALIYKRICFDNNMKKHTYFIVMIYVFLLGIFVYNLFNINIGCIIASEEGFYNIDNLIIKSNFKEYSYSYFDSHFPQLLGNNVYFCVIEDTDEQVGWSRELFVGKYSDNIYCLLHEMDIRTEYQYQIVSQFNQSICK